MVKDIPAIPLFNGGAWAGYTTVHAVGWPSAEQSLRDERMRLAVGRGRRAAPEPGVITRT